MLCILHSCASLFLLQNCFFLTSPTNKYATVAHIYATIAYNFHFQFHLPQFCIIKQRHMAPHKPILPIKTINKNII